MRGARSSRFDNRIHCSLLCDTFHNPSDTDHSSSTLSASKWPYAIFKNFDQNNGKISSNLVTTYKTGRRKTCRNFINDISREFPGKSLRILMKIRLSNVFKGNVEFFVEFEKSNYFRRWDYVLIFCLLWLRHRYSSWAMSTKSQKLCRSWYFLKWKAEFRYFLYPKNRASLNRLKSAIIWTKIYERVSTSKINEIGKFFSFKVISSFVLFVDLSLSQESKPLKRFFTRSWVAKA